MLQLPALIAGDGSWEIRHVMLGTGSLQLPVVDEKPEPNGNNIALYLSVLTPGSGKKAHCLRDLDGG